MQASAQLGGTSTYRALSLPSSPRAAGMGGSSLGVFGEQIDLALENPALIDSFINEQLSFHNTFYLAGTNYGAISYARQFRRAGTFLFGLRYMAYGKFDGRDIAGNPTGDFRAGDYVIFAGTGRSYKNFHYGAQVKLLYSHLESYSSLGMALDAAGTFHNPEKGLTASLILKNAGIQFKPYLPGDREKLPLELSFGFSKKFRHLPFKIIIVAHNLQAGDISYFDPDLQEGENILGISDGPDDASIPDKIFRHFIFGGEIDFGKYLSARFGYNHLRRQEMVVSDKKGLVGVTVGASVHIRQFTLDYGFAKYHIAEGVNSLGISIDLNAFGRPVQPVSTSAFME